MYDRGRAAISDRGLSKRLLALDLTLAARIERKQFMALMRCEGAALNGKAGAG